jgi:hypothetical protein
LRLLSRHQTAIGVVALVLFAWATIWMVYDYRSPVSQFMRGIGTVQIDGWSAYDLDIQCVRLEAAQTTPSTTPDVAIAAANQKYPGGYIREVLLVSFHDTCNAVPARLAWAVSMSWVDAPGAAVPSHGSPARAIVLVDAISGKLIEGQAEGQG